MFTGLIEEMGTIASLERDDVAARIEIDTSIVVEGVTMGASIAVNGCCLTVVSIDGGRLGFDAGSETLSRTNLGNLTPGDAVNLERSIKVGDRMGGHFVTGHVDGLGTIQEIRTEGDWSHYRFVVDERLSRQMASKGSVAVDGISLTLVEVTPTSFSVALVPHTLSVTTLGSKKVGNLVNLETDVLAKYVEAQIAAAGNK
ncbi:MAG: riboflavin synthase [Pirellulaceae bacterium]